MYVAFDRDQYQAVALHDAMAEMLSIAHVAFFKMLFGARKKVHIAI